MFDQNLENFRKDLTDLINYHSIENGSNTPDFILADYLVNCLQAYNKSSIWRAKWLGPGVPMEEGDNGPQPPYIMGPELDPIWRNKNE